MVIKSPAMKIPKVNLCVILLKEEKVLLGKMKDVRGSTEWRFPEDYLGFYEHFAPYATNIIIGKTGLSKKCFSIIDDKPCAVTNDLIFDPDKHNVTLYLRARYKLGNIEVKEPDKCEGWNWFKWDELPNNSSVSINNLLKQGYNPFD